MSAFNGIVLTVAQHLELTGDKERLLSPQNKEKMPINPLDGGAIKCQVTLSIITRKKQMNLPINYMYTVCGSVAEVHHKMPFVYRKWTFPHNLLKFRS